MRRAVRRFEARFARGCVVGFIGACLGAGFGGDGARAEAGGPRVGPPSNDDCATPAPISGAGVFTFDLTGATTGMAGQSTACDPNSPEGIQNDVWFCWTATCTGVVTISTCGQTNANTKIAFYRGCGGCPGGGTPSSPTLLCCNDNGPPPCGEQALVTCEVVCGEQYMIQIGNPSGTAPGGSGTFTIDCAGQPCEPPQPPAGCCNERPRFLPVATFPGVVGAQTADRGILTGPGSEVVVMYDLDERPSNLAPIGCTSLGGPDFQATALWNTARHADPSWSKDNLGTVFGVCIDNFGHTYVAHSSSYPNHGGGSGDRLGALAGAGLGAGAGAIYRIDSATGAPTLFAKLPNNAIVGCAMPDPVQNECYPGLGNITFDCDNAQFFVTNFMDGRIYRIRQSDGMTLETFKHGSGLVVAGNTLDPIDVAGFIPITPDPITQRGRRVWAVEVHNDRLYYSVWREDFTMPNLNVGCGRDDPAHDNEIWSIALNATGGFVSGSETLEATMPAHVTHPSFDLNGLLFFPGNPCHVPSGPQIPFPQNCSNPVSDISFDGSGCMLAAERTMDGDTGSNAHLSRLVKFCPTPGGGWAASPYNTFRTGASYGGFWLNESNTVGGVDVDRGPNGRVWHTADAMALPFNPSTQPGIYGMQGTPVAGGDVCVSACVDSNSISTSADKFKQGSVAVTCALACSEIVDRRLECSLDGTGAVTWTFTITNNSGVPALYALLTPPIGSGVSFSPNVIALPPLPNGGSTTITTTIQGAKEGEFCFDVTLLDETLQACCTIEHCLDIPDCSCGTVRNETLVCVGNGVYTYTFDLINLSNMPNQVFYLIPGPGSGVTFNPNFFSFATPLPQLGVVTLTTTVTGTPGSMRCFTISMHDDHLVECCSFEHCFTLPEPCECEGDLNGDGVVDFLDLALMLANYGQVGGVTACDIDGDGDVDFEDLNMLLSVYGVPC